jgi:hypothetical protein
VLPHDNDFENPVTYRGVIYDGDEMIGTNVAGIIAHRNRRTIINWCSKGYLPSKKIGGERGQYYIKIVDLVTILEQPGVRTRPTEDVAA